MDYLPIFLNLRGLPCLVVGGGTVAARKISLLTRAGADIRVVARNISDSVRALSGYSALDIKERAFAENDLDGVRLVVCATDNHAVNLAVADAANRRQLLLNIVDCPELCNFFFPAIVDRSPIVAAISSGGTSPILSRLLRSKIESSIPSAYGLLAQLAEKFRPQVKQHIPDATQRRIFWERVLRGKIAELVFAGKQEEAETLLHSRLFENQPEAVQGEVYLVGAGPGDPDLLTFRALRLMQQADVIVYDRLVSPEILALARRDAERIYVGKQRNDHTLPQESINELLAKLALSGKQVVRLKGGDPFIFGRGGEEIETLMQQGISFQVVPGITAASGCASYAGIPLTHRDHAQSCIFVTGHLRNGSMDLNWRQLAAPNQTVVIYMGLVGLKTTCGKLIEYGCSPSHPIAIVQQGTTKNQRVVTGTLENLPVLAEQSDIKPPTLIIVGSVVALHRKLNWYQPSSRTESIVG